MTRDNRGRPLAPGDTVRFVYGGDLHQGAVTSLDDGPGVPHVTVAVTVTVPAATTHCVAVATVSPTRQSRKRSSQE